MCTEDTTDSLLDPNVRRVIDVAKQELKALVEQRTHISRRIATTKAAIVGLASVFGNAALQKELREFMPGVGRVVTRQPGLTRACRLLLSQAQRPISSQKISEDLRLLDSDLALRYKNLDACIRTILNRLVSYGEARPVKVNGRRYWEWVRTEEANSIVTPDLPLQSE